jgi:hypothetical protein
MATHPVYELAGGEITLWAETAGGIMLKVRQPFGDPIELGEAEALELAAVLTRLAQDE